MFAESRLRNNATPKLGIRVDCTRRSPLAGNNAKSDRRDFRLNGPLQSQAAQRAFQGTERCFTRIQLCATGIPVRGDKDPQWRPLRLVCHSLPWYIYLKLLGRDGMRGPLSDTWTKRPRVALYNSIGSSWRLVPAAQTFLPEESFRCWQNSCFLAKSYNCHIGLLTLEGNVLTKMCTFQ